MYCFVICFPGGVPKVVNGSWMKRLQSSIKLTFHCLKVDVLGGLVMIAPLLVMEWYDVDTGNSEVRKLHPDAPLPCPDPPILCVEECLMEFGDIPNFVRTLCCIFLKVIAWEIATFGGMPSRLEVIVAKAGRSLS